MTTAQQTEQHHPILWQISALKEEMCLEGQVQSPAAQESGAVSSWGSWEQKRNEGHANTASSLCFTDLFNLTHHLHLTKDIITNWNEILFILGADKYIFDIFILSDNFDYTTTTRITALVSAALISAAQGKIANIKWSWH